MIPFFRKIRKQFADDNKPLKYMRYAIGEIVLVVIGILIALQINTWNEQRKNNNKIISLFKEVQTDLLKDISNIEDVISTYKMKDSLAYLVLNDKLTRDDYEKSEAQFDLIELIAHYEPFQFNTNGYDNLKLIANNIPVINKPIYDTLTVLYEQVKNSLEDQNKRIENTVYENLKYLSNNKEWFSSNYSSWVSNDTIIEYFLHDPFYKNRVKEFRILINDYYKIYKIDAITIYEQLGVITKSNKPLPTHLKNYIVDSESLKPYLGIYKQKDSTQKSPLIINEKGMFRGNQTYIMVHEGNDKFDFEIGYNYSLTFQRDAKGELTGVNFNNYGKKTEYVKID